MNSESQARREHRGDLSPAHGQPGRGTSDRGQDFQGPQIAEETSMGRALHQAGFGCSQHRPRTFGLERRRDVSGVSGIGLVAEGVVFSDGTTVLRWLGSHPTTGIFESIDYLTWVHGHGGSTRVVFHEPTLPNEGR